MHKPIWMKGMKTTSEYIAILRKYMAENAHKYGIVRMGIFGSVARGEQREDSDVDICIESAPMGLMALCSLKDELERILGCNVDILRMREHLAGTSLLNSVTKDVIYV